MKAIVYTEYGAPEDVLQLKEVETPAPKNNEVLVKVQAASVNQGDAYIIRGEPFLFRPTYGLPGPKHTIPGGDVAGRIEGVGRDAKQFQPGDEVYGDIGGCGFGALAEYVAAPESALVLKPAGTTFEGAAAVSQAAIVALQGLRDKGQIQPGQKVLINGASGGVGTFAVQIAKSFGANVTGVCSTRNLDLVRSIGADRVIDYTQEDFGQGGPQYDLSLISRAIDRFRKSCARYVPRGLLYHAQSPRLLCSWGHSFRCSEVRAWFNCPTVQTPRIWPI